MPDAHTDVPNASARARSTRGQLRGSRPRIARRVITATLCALGIAVSFTLTVPDAGATNRKPAQVVKRVTTRHASATVTRSATVTVTRTVSGYSATRTATASSTERVSAAARASATAIPRAVTHPTSAKLAARRAAVALARRRAGNAARTLALQRARLQASSLAYAHARSLAQQKAATLATEAATRLAEAGSGGSGAGAAASSGTGAGGTGSTGTAKAGGGSASGSSDSSCGGEVLRKSDGAPWTCTFDDEFDGTSLDTTKWTAWNSVNYNTNASMCYYDDPSHVWETGGYLNLAVTRLATATQCSTPVGPVNAQYGGAVVHTKAKFSQTGGRFEARIKFGGGTGLHDAFWLWPEYDKQLYPGHAEIDAAEAYGALPNTVFGNTHLNSANGPNDAGAVNACAVANWSAGFHTYAIEWAAGQSITFLFDGVACATFANWTALPGYPNSAPFDQPFFMILQTLVDDGSFSPAPDASTVFPAITQVDYVRVWK